MDFRKESMIGFMKEGMCTSMIDTRKEMSSELREKMRKDK